MFCFRRLINLPPSFLSALGTDPQIIEEEYIVEQPAAKSRKVKVPLSTPRRPEL